MDQVTCLEFLVTALLLLAQSIINQIDANFEFYQLCDVPVVVNSSLKFHNPTEKFWREVHCVQSGDACLCRKDRNETNINQFKQDTRGIHKWTLRRFSKVFCGFLSGNMHWHFRSAVRILEHRVRIGIRRRHAMETLNSTHHNRHSWSGS